MPNPPKPTQLKVLQGNPGHRPLNKDEPTDIPLIDLEPPEHLDETARLHWSKIATRLRAAKIATEIDEDQLMLYCEAYSRWILAKGKCNSAGLIVKTPNGHPIQNPFLAIANKAFEQMMKISNEFGMTPSSRTRVKAQGGGGELDPLEALMQEFHGKKPRSSK